VQRPRLARLSGVLFSLGHGIVVVAVALTVSLLAQAWHAPQWLDSVGMWISVCLLTVLALVNTVAVARTPGHEVARVVGWRSAMFAPLLCARHPLTVLGVGALFALSFDTISQAALFAATAAAYGGWRPALLLGLLFTAGMLLTDGINGWLIWRLIRRCDRAARVASRTVVLAVSAVGVMTAGLALATRLLPAVQLWADGKELWFGAAVLSIVLASFLIGQRLATHSAGLGLSDGSREGAPRASTRQPSDPALDGEVCARHGAAGDLASDSQSGTPQRKGYQIPTVSMTILG
jgi:high-affinity nickel-transport protein